MAKDQWDEKLRGKKMSSQTGKTIYKYQMPVKEQFTLDLPEGAEILRVEDQDGMFWLWALVDIRNPDETRKFRAFKCGAPIPDDVDTDKLEYLGWCAIFVQQELALYVFEEVETDLTIVIDDIVEKPDEVYRQYRIVHETIYGDLSKGTITISGWAAYNAANQRLPRNRETVFIDRERAVKAVDDVWNTL